MKYFIETSKLLNEADFLSIASKVYMAFLELDNEVIKQYIAAGDNFDLTLKMWVVQYNSNTPKLPLGGYPVPFRVYAQQRFRDLVSKDFEAFKALDLSPHDKRNFLEESRELKRAIGKTPYLSMLQQDLNVAIDNALNQLGYLDVGIPAIGEEGSLSPMQWNGNINVLTTLFYELANTELKNKKRRMALDATEDQMIAFICMAFVDKDGQALSPSTIKTYFQESKPERRAQGAKKIEIASKLDD